MRHLIVVLSLLAMAIAGCAGKSNVSLVDREKQAFDDLRAEIRSAINDEAREVKAIALVEELAEELKSLRRKRTERRENSRKLHTNYDTTRFEFDAFINSSNVEIRLNQQRILKIRGDFVAITTPEEWTQIFDARTKAINAAIESIQSI